MEIFEKKELLNILKSLLLIYSPSRKEKELAKFIIDYLENLGCEIYLDDSNNLYNGNAPIIFAKLQGTVKGEGITLSAHMDVIEPNKNLKLIEEDDVIKSDGNTTLGGDDKAGIAAILYVIKYIVENNIIHSDIYMIFTPAEEEGMVGAKNIQWKKVYKNIKPSRNTLILDNSGDASNIAYKAPTNYCFNIEIFGKSAHSGIEPEKGINAIKVLSEIIYKMPIGRIDDLTTLNISIFNSDSPVNVVPDYAKCSGEIRAHSYEIIDKLFKEIKKIIEETNIKYNSDYKFNYERLYPLMDSLDNLKFAKEYKDLFLKYGIEAKLQIEGGGSDGNYFSEEGYNSIIVGVGMEKIHTKEEYLNIKELELATKIIIEYIKKY